MKDAYYFSHDSNAKDDPKCVLLIEQLGLEGYGIFWVLIETLRDQPNYKYPLVLIPALARKYNTTSEKVKTVVLNYGLFLIENDEFFYSDSLLDRMKHLENKRLKASEAGKISAQKRQRMLNGRSTDVQRTLNECSTTVQQVKESKVNEIKVNESIENEKEETLRVDSETKIFIGKILKRYGIEEGNNPRAYIDNYSLISRYMFGELNDSELPEFRKQISCYFYYKEKTGEKMHSLPKLIKEGWKESNWSARSKQITKLPEKPKTNTPIGLIYKQDNYVPGGEAAKIWNES